jgi:hypothetical protein
MSRRPTGVGGKLQRELHWEVTAVLASGRGAGRCLHHHETKDEAVSCDWAPDGWDTDPAMVVCDLLVREFRTEQAEQRRWKREQLTLEGLLAR